MQVRSSNTKEFVVKGKRVGGFMILAYIVHGTAATNLANSDYLPENVIMTLDLYRGGQKHNLMPSTNLKAWLMDSGFYAGSWEKCSPGMAATAATILLEQDAGVKEKWLYEHGVSLHEAIDLLGEDKLVLTVNFQSSALSANPSTADSYLDVEVIADSERWERATPSFDVFNVIANEVKIQRNYAGLHDLKFLNTDKTGILDADAVITQVLLNSEQESYTHNYNQLLTVRQLSFPTKAQSDARAQSHDLYSGRYANKASVDINLVSANVNANKNFLFARTGYRSGRLAKLAHFRAKREGMVKAANSGLAINGKEFSDTDSAIQALLR